MTSLQALYLAFALGLGALAVAAVNLLIWDRYVVPPKTHFALWALVLALLGGVGACIVLALVLPP